LSGLFYVYEHWRPDTGQCFYVGKGKGRRAYKIQSRPGHHGAVTRKLKRLGLETEVRIVRDGLTEKGAHALEQERITLWLAAGAKLANKTRGGDGFAKKHTVSSRLQISAGLTGRPVSRETREKISRTMRERCASGEIVRLGQEKGFKWSVESRLKLSAAQQRRFAISRGEEP